MVETDATPALATHIVLRTPPGMTRADGSPLVTGDLVDATHWRPASVRSYEERRYLERIPITMEAAGRQALDRAAIEEGKLATEEQTLLEEASGTMARQGEIRKRLLALEKARAEYDLLLAEERVVTRRDLELRTLLETIPARRVKLVENERRRGETLLRNMSGVVS